MNAVFSVIEPLPAAIAPPGPWQPVVTGSAFTAGEQPDVIWQARLPEELGAAQAALHNAATRLRADEQALATVEHRLLQVANGAVSFSTLAPQPEQTLLRFLASVEPASGISFGLRDEIQERWQAAQDQLAALSAQAWETLGSYATVETIQGARLIGRTRINWHGDARSLLIADIDLAQAAIHRQTLALALRSRAALLRMVGLVGRGAAIAATMFTSPAGALLALPAVWQFVQEVLAEVRQSMVSST